MTEGDETPGTNDGREASPGGRPGSRRHAVMLRLDPAVHEALGRWAADELRSVNAQTEMIIRRALRDAGRLPSGVGDLPRRGRPPGGSPGPV
jgi:hypothetical protein